MSKKEEKKKYTQKMPNQIILGKNSNKINKYFGLSFVKNDLEPSQNLILLKKENYLYSINNKNDSSNLNNSSNPNKEKNIETNISEPEIVKNGEIDGNFIKPFSTLGKGCVIC